MDRPPTNRALEYFNKTSTRYIYSPESEIYKNYIKTKKIFKKKNFQFIKKKDILSKQKFWFICLNNPRFAIGNKILPTEKKCKIFDDNKNFSLQKKIALPDILLKEYVKN